MMLAVSYADVIIVSQLRSAIALRYDATKHDTPIIVAKGVASVALQIKKIAIHNNNLNNKTRITPYRFAYKD